MNVLKTILISLTACAINKTGFSQASQCVFRDTIFSINFGSSAKTQEMNLRSMKNYGRMDGPCPLDGNYSYATATEGCFDNDWLTIPTDHTPGDKDGKMFLVNASEEASGFFIATLSGFKPGKSYEFSTWLMNVCRINGGCSPLPPDILISLESLTGRQVASFRTGKLFQSDKPAWKRYFGMFQTAKDETILVLKMLNTTNGGCGNDFAMDDINVRECYPVIIEKKISNPAAKHPRAPLTPKQKVPRPETRMKPTPTGPAVLSRREMMPKAEAIRTPVLSEPMLPKIFADRATNLVEEIAVGRGEIVVELYDNGIVDGDTVSIYHNNRLLLSRKGISAEALRLVIDDDPARTSEELVMVAENLGSIPPNTSLMVVTNNGRRHEVFISSSDKMNARVVFKRYSIR